MATVIDTNLKADPTIIVRDPQHAARMFADDNFRLAPKYKFLFHIAFSINPAALKLIDLAQRHKNEINMLVKNVTLPNYTIKTEQLNQYNRKKNVQTTHTLSDVNITFHDDNMGVISQLWQNYYSYYYADSTSAKKAGAYARNAMRNSNYIRVPYGLDNGSSINFFNYIRIYQMARHEYVCYTLSNPIITKWDHSKLDYSQGNQPHDNTMSIQYEAVAYHIGKVEKGDPEGFALEHYDQTPSPLTSSSTDANGPSFVGNQSIVDSGGDFINTVVEQNNSMLNTQQLPSSGSSILNTAISSVQGVSGLTGIMFPVHKQNEYIQTTARRIIS